MLDQKASRIASLLQPILSTGLWAQPREPDLDSGRDPLDSGRSRESQIWTLGAIPWTLGAVFSYPLDSRRIKQNMKFKKSQIALRPESNISIRASL
jgi:hypothetical protein